MSRSNPFFVWNLRQFGANHCYVAVGNATAEITLANFGDDEDAARGCAEALNAALCGWVESREDAHYGR